MLKNCVKRSGDLLCLVVIDLIDINVINDELRNSKNDIESFIGYYKSFFTD